METPLPLSSSVSADSSLDREAALWSSGREAELLAQQRGNERARELMNKSFPGDTERLARCFRQQMGI